MNGSIGLHITRMIIGAGSDFVNGIYGPFVQSFHGLALGLVMLYVFTIAYLLISGRTGQATPHAIASIIIIPFVFSMVFENGIYMDWIYDTFMSTSQNLAGFMASVGKDTSGLTGLFNAVDNIFEKIFSIVDILSAQGGGSILDLGSNLEVGFVVFGLSIIFGVLYCIFTVLIIQGWIMLQLLLAVGGIPLFLSGIPFTRHIFTSWLRACFQHALTPIFTAAVMGLTITALDSAVAHLETINIAKDGVFTSAVGSVFVIGLVSIWLHLKAPDLASALTGGAMTQMGGAIAAGASVVSGTVGAARSAGITGGVQKAASYGGPRAYSAMKGVFTK